MAGVFAFIPVEEASTVHPKIISGLEQTIEETVPPLFTPLFDAFAGLEADHDEILETIENLN